MVRTSVVMVSLLVAVACNEQRPRKRSEARVYLDRIAKLAKVHAVEHGTFPIGTAAQLPTPRTSTPVAGGCCGGTSSGTTPDNKCPVSTAFASDPVWQKLQFTIDEPTLFRYSYASSDGKSFEARAEADLDCDGEPAAYKLVGTLDTDGAPKTEVIDPPKGEY